MSAALELLGVTRRFGAVTALRGASLTVAPGEVHALVGENGAGKSTLMRIAAGMERADGGSVRIRGAPLAHASPAAAIRLGLGMVHQHFMLVETLTAAENVALGREPTRAGLLDAGAAERELDELGERFGLRVPARAPIETLSVGEQQRVEILKVLGRGAEVLVLDEPTAVLAPAEVAPLFAVLRRLAADGKAVVLVTHKLDEVRALADRVTVLRRGEVVAAHRTAETTDGQLVRAIVGRDLAPPPARPPSTAAGEVLLRLTDVAAPPRLAGVTLEVRAGEIVGVAGVEGNGQTELCEAIAGLRPAAGAIALAGRDVAGTPPAARTSAGLAFVPEDRHRRGLVLDFSLAENLILGRQRAFASTFGLLRDWIDEEARALLARYDVRPADPGAAARALSGGNQQKVVLARELARRARVLVAAQPTRGLDLGATEAIWRLLLDARAEGRAVLVVSADLAELRALADRVVVLYRGRVAGALDAAEATEDRVGALMTGAAA